MSIDEETRGRLLAAIMDPANRAEIYRLAMERSREILSGVCRVTAGLPEPEGCPCAICQDSDIYHERVKNHVP